MADLSLKHISLSIFLYLLDESCVRIVWICFVYQEFNLQIVFRQCCVVFFNAHTCLFVCVLENTCVCTYLLRFICVCVFGVQAVAFCVLSDAC